MSGPRNARASVRLLALAAAATLAHALGTHVPWRRAAAVDGGEEEARALDRVLPRAAARMAPSVLVVTTAAGGGDARRKARTALALEADLAVMDGLSIGTTGVDDLVLEDSLGVRHRARLRGRDLRLRLIAVECPDRGLVPAPRSGRAPDPGTHVLALGGVYGSGGKPSAAFGIVSALGRFDGRAIQVDCGIDPSNAGGALVDLEGALVAVPVLVDRKLGDDSGVGFAVPWARIESALPRLRKGDELEAGFLGIVLPKDDPSVAPSLEGGVKVEGIVPGGAAKAAGLRTDDVIVKVDRRPVRGVRALVSALSDRAAGDKVTLDVLRAGAELQVEATLGSRK